MESIPDFFPKIYSRTDNFGYTSDMIDGWYGLESFIKGFNKERNLDYFSLLGGYINLLHQQLDSFSRSNNLESLISEDSYLSESNIASIFLDLLINSQKHDFLLSEIEKIIAENLSFKIKSLRKSLIHRDLNQSNILWIRETPKIIDSESIRIATRINEFIPALILKGNRNRPNYIKGSLSTLINSYNKVGRNILSKDEEDILPSLLKYSLLRYYVIRTIRRNIEKKDYLELEKDLNKLNEDLK